MLSSKWHWRLTVVFGGIQAGGLKCYLTIDRRSNLTFSFACIRSVELLRRSLLIGLSSEHKSNLGKGDRQRTRTNLENNFLTVRPEWKVVNIVRIVGPESALNAAIYMPACLSRLMFCKKKREI